MAQIRAMPSCPRCGSQNLSGARFCMTCGNQLSAAAPGPVTIFYSYSHKDEDLRRGLETHLAALRRSGLIAEWHDRKLLPGQEWDKEINKYLESARLVLLLISADFLNSAYITDVEVKRALERQAAGQAIVIPVILRPVVWKIIPEFARLQALPDGARPVTDWSSWDAAFVSVCEGIVAVVLAEKAKVDDDWRAARRQAGATPSRKRVLDAALPARVPVARPSTLLVMIRRTDARGLRGLVAADPIYDIVPDDVDSHPLNVKFPVDNQGVPQPLNLTVKIESPQFDPPTQTKDITLPPRGDSEARIFLLRAKEKGPLLVNLELYRGADVIASCVLRTEGFVEGTTTDSGVAVQSVASAALPASMEEHASASAATESELSFNRTMATPPPPAPQPSAASPPPPAPPAPRPPVSHDDLPPVASDDYGRDRLEGAGISSPPPAPREPMVGAPPPMPARYSQRPPPPDGAAPMPRAPYNSAEIPDHLKATPESPHRFGVVSIVVITAMFAIIAFLILKHC